MDEGEANQLDERACEAEGAARDALKSLVQAARDHAATMRRLAAVEAERDAALAEVSRLREGADPTPGATGTPRTAGSWWHLLLEAKPEPRLNMLAALLRGFRG